MAGPSLERPPRQRFQTQQEIIQYHAGRKTRAVFSVLDVTSHERAHYFTVVKAMDPELLFVFKTSITDALIGGQSFETWRKALMPGLAACGFAGPQSVADPKGRRAPATVDFTDPERLQSIFWAHTGMAHAAGQWIRAQTTKAALPYILYCGPAFQNACELHKGWAGTILPMDDPWWATHWPPNGWGCTCSVRQITARERDKLLIQGIGRDGCLYRANAPDDGPLVPFLNTRTGWTQLLPVGVDFSWAGNPGLDRTRPLSPRNCGRDI